MTGPVPKLVLLLIGGSDFATHFPGSLAVATAESLRTYPQRTATRRRRIFTAADSINSDHEAKEKQTRR